MPDVVNAILVRAPSRQVVCGGPDVSYQANYLSTLAGSRMNGGDHELMGMESHGQRYEDSGFFRALTNRLESCSADHDYHGEMQVEGDERQSVATIRISKNLPDASKKRLDDKSSGD